MTDIEKLDLIISEITGVKTNVAEMKNELTNVKNDVREVNLHLKNTTDKNIAIVAENHINLVNKLNEAIKVSDRLLVYEVHVSYLRKRMDKLETEFAEMKKQSA